MCALCTPKYYISSKSPLNLKRVDTSSKLVHYFEGGSKDILLYDVEKSTQSKISINKTFEMPQFCRTIATHNGRIFCMGGRNSTNQ